VIVEPPGGASVLVTAIRVQFVDSSGVAARQVTLPAPVPMTQFGSDLERSRSAFPLTIGIGCGTQSTGSLVILVEARDSLGRTVMGRTTVSVR
jgi:hypothetical protein